MTETDRAVSTTLSYVLTLAIAAILASGLITAAGGFVDDRREEAVRDGLSISGQQVASRLMAADRLAESGGTTVEVTVPLPDAIGGSGYTVEVKPGSSTIFLNATEVDVSVSVSYRATTPVAASAVSGGDLVVVLTDAGDLEVRSA